MKEHPVVYALPSGLVTKEDAPHEEKDLTDKFLYTFLQNYRKNHVSSMCLASAVASWSLTQEVAGLQVRALLMINIFVTEFSEFIENI